MTQQNPFAPQQQAPAGNPFAPQQTQPPAQPAATPPAPSGPFRQPASGGGDMIEWTDHLGQLVLVEPITLQRDINTKNGKADAWKATVTVIDCPPQPRVYRDTLIFPRVLVSQIGDGHGMVLGRLGQYTTKEGRTTVELVQFTAQDADLAGRYLAWRQQQSIVQPAPAQPAQQAPPTQQQGGWTTEPPF